MSVSVYDIILVCLSRNTFLSPSPPSFFSSPWSSSSFFRERASCYARSVSIPIMDRRNGGTNEQFLKWTETSTPLVSIAHPHAICVHTHTHIHVYTNRLEFRQVLTSPQGICIKRLFQVSTSHWPVGHSYSDYYPLVGSLSC